MEQGHERTRRDITAEEQARLRAQYAMSMSTGGQMCGTPVGRLSTGMNLAFFDYVGDGTAHVNWDLVIVELLRNPPARMELAPANAFFVYLADNKGKDCDFYDFYQGKIDIWNSLQSVPGEFYVEYRDAVSGSVPIVTIGFRSNI